MHHPRSALLLKKGLGKQADEVVALDKPPGVIEEKTAIEITIPSQADIGASRTDRLDGRTTIFLQHGVWHAVWEIAVGLVMDLDEFERQERLEQIDERAGTAVTGIHDDLERP